MIEDKRKVVFNEEVIKMLEGNIKWDREMIIQDMEKEAKGIERK